MEILLRQCQTLFRVRVLWKESSYALDLRNKFKNPTIVVILKEDHKIQNITFPALAKI